MSEVFHMVPASSKPLWFLGGVCLLLLAVLALLAWTAYSSRSSRFEVRPDALALRGDLWSRTIPIADLELGAAEILDLRQARDRAPRWRTMGTGLPGYSSGWFRLRNGEKALAYLTHHAPVVYLPTARGYALLLSVDRPEPFLAALRARAGA